MSPPLSENYESGLQKFLAERKMRAYDIIFKKRNGKSLTKEELEFFVLGFTAGNIPDYQASAFLMAVAIRGMDAKETALLTSAMADSGEKLDLSSVPGIKVDKHSTGGVGDGTSLVLAPLVASCGVPVPMVSGRGLGHTGGTLDKLESIPGFRITLSKEEFILQLKKIGVAIIGQTAEFAPADRKLYALRDVTATVDSIPLISASILSKKLAEGCDGLVLDVKTGSGAFMQGKKDAVQLARTMVNIGKKTGKNMAAIISDMNQPLGRAVGNSLEIEQSIEILKGKEEPHTKSFIELTETLGGWMLVLAKMAENPKKGAEKIRKARTSGAGLAKFREMVQMQGGEPSVVDDPKRFLPRAKKVKPVCSLWKGTICEMRAREVGISAAMLGAGREKQESSIDYTAGIILHKKVGDKVERSEPIADFHYSDDKKLNQAEKIFLSALKIGKSKPKVLPLVYEYIR